MSLLLIGCGYWGKNWAKTLHKIGALGAICETNREQHAALQAQYPHVALYKDLSKALEHPGLKGAVLATPVASHFPLAMQCIEYGLPILIEKPMTRTGEQAQRLMEAASRKNVLVAVGHLLVYHPALLKLKSLIQQGALGEILTVYCTRAKMGKIRNDENVWLSFAPHDLSILIYLLDEPLEIVSVSPFNALKRSGLEDGVMASFRTPSGKEANIFVSWLYPVKKMETIVVGSKKIAIFEDATTVPTHKLKWMGYDLTEKETDAGREIEDLKSDNLEPIEFAYQDPLEAEAQAFLHAISGSNGSSLPNHGENGRQVVALLEQVNALITEQRQNKKEFSNPAYAEAEGCLK